MDPARTSQGSARRLPLQQQADASRSAGPRDSQHSRRPITVPSSPKMRGEGLLGTSGTGARRGSATGKTNALASGSVLQKALSSDEFIKRKRTVTSENTSTNISSNKPPSRPMSRTHSSSSTTSSNGSSSTIQQQSRIPHPQPRASRSQTSLSSRQRSKSRTRASRPSPVLAAAILPALPPTLRTVSSSSCPEPRGATLSTPTTSEPVMAEVLAEGELELRGLGGGNAAEVLVELRDGRSVPSSEYGDDDRDSETLADSEPTVTYSNSHPTILPDIPLPSHALTSESAAKSNRRPSTSRHRSSPSAISTALANSKDGARRYSSHSAMSMSPRTASPERLLSISPAVHLPSPSTSPRGPATQHRGRPLASTSPTAHERTPSQSRPLVVEKRMRRCSVEPPTPSSPIRPALHTYTSFESAFGVEAPRSPTGSPTKVESKGWWSRS